MDVDQPDTLDLRDYLAVLRRRRWTVVATTLLVVGVALGVTLVQTPMYESEVRLVVEPSSTDDDSLLRQIVLGEQELETQREVVESTAVAERVIKELELGTTPEEVLEDVTAEVVTNTQILEIRARSTSPQRARTLAQAFSDAYLEFRRKQALDKAMAAAEAIRQRADEVRIQLNDLSRRRARTAGPAAQALAQQETALLAQLGQLTAQSATLQAPESFVAGGGRVIHPAQLPESPASPKPLRTGILALVLGLMLGVGLAFLRDFLDDSIRSETEAERAVGRPVVGYVPRWPASSTTQLASLVDPSSSVAEAYRSLRANVRFLTVGRRLPSLLVTSAVTGEGKTTTSANLAVAAAGTAGRVVLLSADLRRPAAHKLFGLDGQRGLTDVLAGDAELRQVLVDVGAANLRVLPSGRIPPNPAELLASAAMSQLLQELEHLADLLIIDGPPVLAVADALELAPRVGGVLLVVDAGRSGRHAVRAAAQRLTGLGANLIGTVLNNMTAGDGYYGYYYTDYTNNHHAGRSWALGRQRVSAVGRSWSSRPPG